MLSQNSSIALIKGISDKWNLINNMVREKGWQNIEW